MRRAILKSLQAGGVLLVAAATLARADEWTKKFALTGKPELRVDTGDGDVEVRVGDSKQIEARVETVGWRISPDAVRVVDRQTGDRVELEIKVPTGRATGATARSAST